MYENRLRKYLLLWCLGIYLRLGVLIIPPLLPRLESLLGYSTAQVAIATSLPVLFIAAGSLGGEWMSKRFGIAPMVIVGLLVMATAGALRSLPVDFAAVLLFTAVMGGGIALMQVGLPALARKWMPDKVGRGTAVYINGLLMGEVFATGLTDPLVSHILGNHWRWIFALWMLPAPALAASVPVRHHNRLSATAYPAAGTSTNMRSHWRNPLLWRTGILLGASGGLYLSGNVFLPQLLLDSGRLHLITPALIALNGMQLISSAMLMLLADRLLARRWPIAAALLLALAAIAAMLILPGVGPVWMAALFGFASSSLLTLALALPAALTSVADLPGLMAGSLALGYLLVFLVPSLGGWAHAVTGQLTAAFAPAATLAMASLALTMWLGKPGGRSSEVGVKEADW